jgi:Helix-turn-helix domain
MKTLLQTTPAASYLGLRPQTLRARRQRGDGPRFVRVARNRVLYDLAELDRWLNERTFASTTEAQQRTGPAPLAATTPASSTPKRRERS